METAQSFRADSTFGSPQLGKTLSESTKGRKSSDDSNYVTSTGPAVSPDDYMNAIDELANVLADDETEYSTSEEYESDEEDIDEEWEERRRILEDARNLKAVAEFFLHPEKTVKVSATATARCFFDRPSAPERVSAEDAEEERLVMEDMKSLKKLAVDYLHPEIPVVTSDPVACGRNYFVRSSAPQQETFDDAEEKARILEEAAQLRQCAKDYLHPENGVTTTDPLACARNFFERPSAYQQDTSAEAEERAIILAEAQQLKKFAVDYMHPEIPVSTTDPCAFGRNFFARPSAPEYESAEDAEERELIMEEMKQMKKLARDYLHPEVPVKAEDPTCFGRNYFARATAPDQESKEDADERVLVLEEAAKLKKVAVDYLHPELPVSTTDPASFGRNYFSRPSALEKESFEDAEERALIMAETKQLKRLAVDYMHPEVPVRTEDPAACGRNFFSRPSAPEYDDSEGEEERTRVLEEAKQLKKLAVDYMHPEMLVVTADPAACGRNYFSRPSAPQMDAAEDAEERARILEEARQLKKVAVDYMHPELPVVTADPAACGRNYFSRPSAPAMEAAEDAEERARILEEARQFKKVAVDYMHPELPVVTSDPTACGRNYFSRPSAPENELRDEPSD